MGFRCPKILVKIWRGVHFCQSKMLKSNLPLYYIGVGRLRIFGGGPRFRILGGGGGQGGEQIPSRHMMTY